MNGKSRVEDRNRLVFLIAYYKWQERPALIPYQQCATLPQHAQFPKAGRSGEHMVVP
jgi:hypothetical protein